METGEGSFRYQSVCSGPKEQPDREKELEEGGEKREGQKLHEKVFRSFGGIPPAPTRKS
jgi:hypothetical protein